MLNLLLGLLLAGSAQAGIIAGGSPTNTITASSAAATYVNKAGDTMTGRLTAPDATLTYGLTASTGSFSGSVTASSVTANSSLDTQGFRAKRVDGGQTGGLGIDSSGSNYGTAIYRDDVEAAIFENGGLILGSYLANDAPSNGLIVSGSVGIGTASPATTLDVNGNAQFGTTFKSTFSATGQLKVANGTTLTEDALIVATNTNDRGMTLTNTSGSDLFKVRRNGSSDSAYLQLSSVGATKISFISGTGGSYINNSGAQLGIATDSPCSTCTLHVAGGASVTGNMSVGTVTNDTKFDVKGTAVTPNSGLDAAQAIMSVYGAGQLGIGSDGASPFGMWMQTFDHTATSPAAYPILLNPALGTVGVGTNAPASKFHVSSGTIRIDGTGAPTTGGALCLNAGGAMSKCTSAIDASGNCTCP